MLFKYIGWPKIKKWPFQPAGALNLMYTTQTCLGQP